MKKGFKFFYLMLLAFCLIACEENDVNKKEVVAESPTQYVVCYSSGENGYIMQVDDITSGLLDGTKNINNRQQVTGNTDYVPVGYKYLYNINYASKSSAGTSTVSTSWKLNKENQLTQRTDFDFSGDIKSRGVWKKYIIGASSLADGEPKRTYEHIKILDTESQQVITNEGRINTAAGEYSKDIKENVIFSDIAEYGEYILVALSTKESTAKSAKTNLAFNSYLAVYKYAPENNNEYLKLEKIITRESTPEQPAGQVMGNNRSRRETGIEVLDNGDIYMFCNGTEGNNGLAPSALLRITKPKNGMPEKFDTDYYVNLEKLMNGHRLWRTYYLGDTKFCLQLFTNPGVVAKDTKTKFVIFDVKTKAVKWVEGMPEDVADIALLPLIEKELGRVTFAVQTKSQLPALYTITKDGKMTRGLEIKAEKLSGVAKLIAE